MHRQITLSDLHRNLPAENREDFLRALPAVELNALMAQVEASEDIVSDDDKIDYLVAMLMSFDGSEDPMDIDDAKMGDSSVAALTDNLARLRLQDTLVHTALTNGSTDDDFITQDGSGYFLGRLVQSHVPIGISGKGNGCLPTSFLTYLLNSIPLPRQWSSAGNSSSLEVKFTAQEMNGYATTGFKDIFAKAMERSRKDFKTHIGDLKCSSDSFDPDTLVRPLMQAMDVKKYQEIVDFFAQDALLWVCHSKMPGLKYEGNDERFLATTFMRLMTHVPVVRLVNSSDLTPEEKGELGSNERLAGHHDLAAFSAVFGLACDNYWRLPNRSETNQGQTIKFAGQYNKFALKKINLLYTFGNAGHFDLLLPLSEYQNFYAALNAERCALLITALEERLQERKPAFKKIKERTVLAPKMITDKIRDSVFNAQKKEAELLGINVSIEKNEMPEFIHANISVHLNNLDAFATAIEARYQSTIEHLKFIQTLFFLNEVTVDGNNFIKLTFLSTNHANLFVNRLRSHNGLRYAIGVGVEDCTVTVAHENDQGLQNTLDLLYHALPLPDFQNRLKRVSKIGPHREVLVLHQPESQPAVAPHPMNRSFPQQSIIAKIEIDGEMFTLSGSQEELTRIIDGINAIKGLAVGDSDQVTEARETLAGYKKQFRQLGFQAASANSQIVDEQSIDEQLLKFVLMKSMGATDGDDGESKVPPADNMTDVVQSSGRKRSSDAQEASEREVKRHRQDSDGGSSSSSSLFQPAAASLPENTDDAMTDGDTKNTEEDQSANSPSYSAFQNK